MMLARREPLRSMDWNERRPSSCQVSTARNLDWWTTFEINTKSWEILIYALGLEEAFPFAQPPIHGPLLRVWGIYIHEVSHFDQSNGYCIYNKPSLSYVKLTIPILGAQRLAVQTTYRSMLRIDNGRNNNDREELWSLIWYDRSSAMIFKHRQDISKLDRDIGFWRSQFPYFTAYVAKTRFERDGLVELQN